jgi:Ca-activated chloride channel family protein
MNVAGALTRCRAFILLIFGVSLLAGCGVGATAGQPFFRIVSGSENQPFETLLTDFAKSQGKTIQVTYQGSVDIMRDLQRGSSTEFDAVWPANSMWITLGDSSHVVKYQTSIMRSPVVFGIKRSIAQRLGWVGRDVTMDEILQAADGGQLRFMMTSATQSNSGASAYFGFLYAFAGHPDVLTAANLQDPTVQGKVKRILGAVNRSAGSSGWLKDLFLQRYNSYDAMVNYEALVIEANQALVKSGREPLYVIYPVDGLAIADSPFGYVNKGDAAKEDFFQKLQRYLLSSDTQTQIQKTGRRTGPLGVNPTGVDPSVFNPEWGIDTRKVLSPINFPAPDVILQALDLYQTTLRKPSFTVFCLDYSGSMAGQREDDLKAAMALILDQDQAKQYLLQASTNDVNVVIPFNNQIISEDSVVGNNPGQLGQLLADVRNTPTGGGTDIFSPVIRGYEILKQQGYDGYSPSIILMTDGESNTGAQIGDLQRALQSQGIEGVPVYAIRFGEASEDQLKQITDLTSGRIFDGREHLVDAFREAKGYN